MVVDTRYYEILQVQSDADELTIKKVFLKPLAVFWTMLTCSLLGLSTPSDTGMDPVLFHFPCLLLNSTILTRTPTLLAPQKRKLSRGNSKRLFVRFFRKSHLRYR